MDLFRKVLGHSKIIDSLRKALAAGKPPQSLLFFGPSGVGKKMTAYGWAQGLLCKSSTQQKPCGECNSCLKTASGNHPDLLFIKPEGASIKAEQAREIQNFVYMKSYEGGAKVIIIDDAHLLGANAGNALLKTLEEPPPQTYFVLVTPQKGAVLTTIQSRCQKSSFGNLSDEDLKKITGASDWVLSLSQGRADIAMKYQDTSWGELRAQALRAFQNIFQGNFSDSFQELGELHGERETALFAVNYWLTLVRHALALKLGAKTHKLSDDETPVVANLQHNLTIEGLEKLGSQLFQLEQDVVHNVHKALAFEQFCIQAKEGLS